MKFIKAHILQMDTPHLGYIAADKITSIHSVTMVKPAPDSTEEDPKTTTEQVTVVNIAGQQPVFVTETPRVLLTQLTKKEA